ncbi:MAG TPA: PIG-L family deacetylase [Candidatus Limnocylindria bacterium]|jgi:LmbE family N-acetylglucosaminyl deacetylase|nr:PIG-L family deacetylase [Candidatus Limnocylindria bacterium]
MNLISRRTLLQAVGAAGATLASGAGSAAEPKIAEQSSKAPNERRLRVVVTGGHPGDPECGCGGVIARYVGLGHEVVLLYLNKGDPSEDPVKGANQTRVEEAKKACEILKTRPVFAGQIDAHAIVDATHYDRFFHLLEVERPDVVFTHWPVDNHRDHRAMSMLVYDAWLRMKRNFALYYYEVSNGEDTVQFAPTELVDITGVESEKRQACYAHASQEPKKFYALQEQVMRMRGIEKGCKFAEGYIRHVQSPYIALPH